MRFRCLLSVFAVIAAMVNSSPQAKASLVYQNGPITISGTAAGWNIVGENAVSDSFIVTGDTTLTGAQVGLWASLNDYPTSVDWSIGTFPFGSQVSSGTGSSLDNSYQFTNSQGYAVLESTFSLNGMVTAGTTYWFTLTNAVLPSANGIAYWDQNSGPSSAMQQIGHEAANPIPSESFQLYDGQVTAIPEPSTIVIWSLLGCVAIGLAQWRKRMVA
ncbi:MAG: hypothetical protein ACLP9L_19600 [Thermoguttaceae bacterium]